MKAPSHFLAVIVAVCGLLAGFVGFQRSRVLVFVSPFVLNLGLLFMILWKVVVVVAQGFGRDRLGR